MYYYTYCEKIDNNIYNIEIIDLDFSKIIENLKKKYAFQIKKKKIYKNEGLTMELYNNMETVYIQESKSINITNSNNLLFIKEFRIININQITNINIHKNIDDEYNLIQYIFNINDNDSIICNILLKKDIKINYLEIISNKNNIDNIVKYINFNTKIIN